LWCIGVPKAFLWGILAGILRLTDLKKAVNADEAAALILEETTAGYRTETNIQPSLVAKSAEFVSRLVANESGWRRAT
jgi:hypothetical protein